MHLDLIELISSDDQLHTSISLAEQIDPFKYLWAAPIGMHINLPALYRQVKSHSLLLRQASNIDAHREHTNIYEAASSTLSFANPHTPRYSLNAQASADSLSEVSRIVRSLKPDKVRTENSAKELLPHAQAAEDLGRGKSDMEEEPNWRRGGEGVAQHEGKK